MNIKKIKKLSSNKYQILFDTGDKIITYDEVILKYNLLYAKEIDTKLLNELNKSNSYYAIYNDLIKYLTKKLHSRKEYFDYIKKYDLSTKDKDRLTKELENLNLLNDNIFAKAYIQDKFYLSNDGPYKIKKDLLDHNIDESVIDSGLALIDKEELNNKVSKLISKKLKLAKGSSYLIKQKIKQDMYNLGYDKNDIELYLDSDIDDSLSLEKDFNKYYRDYERKEKDLDKLYLKIKQKLYQKGYSLSSIDELINKKRNS